MDDRVATAELKQNAIVESRRVENRAAAIGKKVAPILDPENVAASLETLATAAYQLQHAEPEVAAGLQGLAAVLHSASTSHSVSFMFFSHLITLNLIYS